MYYQQLSEAELGFDAFIAPDGFDHEDLSGDHPVDIYAVFKREYALNSHARYIYYYSPGNYPLTLTPTATEYYRYGYTNALNQEVVVNVPLNGSPVTIWGNNITTPLNTSGGDESGYTKRWVIVYRTSTEKFSLFLNAAVNAVWYYLGNKIYKFNNLSGGPTPNNLPNLKYIHFANINSMTEVGWSQSYANMGLTGKATLPETVSSLGPYFVTNSSVTKVSLPNTKALDIENWQNPATTLRQGQLTELSLGKTSDIDFTDQYWQPCGNLQKISVSEQNALYMSYDGCDILFTKNGTQIKWIAIKTTRGLILPDTLPQSQITNLVKGQFGFGTDTTPYTLSTNIMQGFPLRLGTQISDLTNLYLSNKSFTYITVGENNVGSEWFVAENNILFNANKTTLIKAGTASTGSLVIPSSVTSVSLGAFLRYPTTSRDLIFSGAGQYDLSVYNNFGFANFTAESIKSIIDNDQLVNGTVGSPKYFHISKTTYDALVALPGGQASIDLAAGRFINVISGIIQDGLKLWLDASNPLSYPGSGTTWYDLSGNGNNGTMVNGVVPLSNAMSFDGVNDYVNVINPIQNPSIMTISIWAYIRENKTQLIYGYRSGSQELIQITAQSSTLAYFQIRGANGSLLQIPQTISINTWYNYTCEFNKLTGVHTFWLNSVPVTGSLNLDGIALNSTLQTIGSTNTGTYANFANILTNDHTIYNRALTADEVNQNFQATRSKYGI